MSASATQGGHKKTDQVNAYYCTALLVCCKDSETEPTRRPASADRTARRQFQATGQPVSRTQAGDAMTSRLPRYQAKCATHLLPMRVGPFAFRYQRNGATPCQHIDTTRKAIDYATTLPLTVFIIIKLCSRLFVHYCRNCPKDDKFR